MQAIDTIVQHAERIASGKDDRVKPGQPVRFTDGCCPGDAIRQGDLYLEIVARVPAGYVQIKKPTTKDRQLVPGNTEGAKHCLDALAGVKLYRPADWNAESLVGPCLVLSKERTILHPTHGAVTVPAGMTVLCRCQREFDAETRRERRAVD